MEVILIGELVELCGIGGYGFDLIIYLLDWGKILVELFMSEWMKISFRMWVLWKMI